MRAALRWRLAFLMICASLWGCSEDTRAIRVGAKSFAEQRVLAEALITLLRAEGLPAEKAVPCQDTYGCQRALRSGAIDLMVEYTGTGLSFVGAAPQEADGLAQVRKLYKPLGMRWVVPLGFDNGYRLLVSRDKARVLGLRQITDLARIEGGIRIAAPTEFLRRPGDGLAALLRRYGLRAAAAPVVLDDPAARMDALLNGRADVAVGYATDGAIVGLGLEVLDDSLGFFPSYEAAVVARTEALSTHRGLEAVLNRLHNRITVEEMRRANYAVEVSGQPPKTVALQLLKAESLIPEAATRKGAAPVVVAMGSSDGMERPSQRALRAVSEAFSGRPVKLKAARDPVQSVISGEARLAILGAERFFPRRRGEQFIREDRLEAVAALGTRMIHILRRPDDVSPTDPLDGRVGLQPRDSGGGWAGDALLSMVRGTSAMSAPLPELIEALKANKIDVAIVLVEAGDPALSSAIQAGGVALTPLTAEWTSSRVSRLPFFREARIPMSTYANQQRPLESLAAQVVIAGPSRKGIADGGGGPAVALHPSSRPLTSEQVSTLATATRVAEAPDPALPSAWRVKSSGFEPLESEGISPSAVDTVLNLGVFAFLFWLVGLIRR